MEIRDIDAETLEEMRRRSVVLSMEAEAVAKAYLEALNLYWRNWFEQNYGPVPEVNSAWNYRLYEDGGRKNRLIRIYRVDAGEVFD